MSERVESEPGTYAVAYDSDLGAVVLEWYDDVGGSVFRDVMESVLDSLREHDAAKLLVDAREQGTMDPEDRAWATEDWVPRATEAGLEYAAGVYPDDPAAKSSVDRYARQTPFGSIQELYAEDMESARGWLRRR